MEFTFTLRYRLAQDDSNHDQLVERLGAAGCTDALVGIGRDGYLALQFLREAESIEIAVASASEDVQRAIPYAELIEVSGAKARAA